MSYTIAIAGHVDHGKTSLVRALTGVNTDRLPEEVRRGLTIDLAFAHGKFSSKSRNVDISFIDVPGHVKFIKNMLAGTGAIKMSLFVVAADDGIMPQTREHFEILKYLGVKNILAVITKCDLAGAEQIGKVANDIKKLFNDSRVPLYDVLTVAVSDDASITNLKNRLVDFVSTANSCDEPSQDEFVRFPIDRSFTVKGFGTVVTGTLPGGVVTESSELVDFKSGKVIKIRGLNVAGVDVKVVNEKTRLAINLQSVEKSQIARGDMLVSPWLYGLTKDVNYMDCAVEFSQFAQVSLKMLQNLKLYFLSSERVVRLRLLKGDSPDSKDGNKDDNKKTHYGRIYIKDPICMGRGDKFILRDPSNNITIGGGLVLTSYLKGKRPFLGFDSSQNLDIFSFDATGDDVSSLKGLLGKVTALPVGDFKVSYPFSFGKLSKDPAFTAINGFISLKETYDGLSEKITKACSHKGLTLDNLIEALGLPAKLKPFVGALLEHMCIEGLVKKDGVIFRLVKEEYSLSEEHKALIRKIESILDDGISSFKKDDLRSKLNIGGAEFDNVFNLMFDKGMVVRLTKDNFILGSVVDDAKMLLFKHFDSSGTITAKEFRDILGTGRKIAIEILEYFDRVNITLRRGDERIKR